MNGYAIKAEGLTKSFRQPNGELIKVLDGIDLSVGRGEMVAITGPSGSGKSTLLHILGLMQKPDNGSLGLLGRESGGMTDIEKDILRRRRIGFLFQFNSLLEELTVRENLALAACLRKSSGNGYRLEETAERFGLALRLDSYPDQLSVGESCRANLIRAVMGSPDLIFADEPTGNLDGKNAKQLMNEFKELLNPGFGAGSSPPAIVLVTHNPEVAASATRTLRLVAGRLGF